MFCHPAQTRIRDFLPYFNIQNNLQKRIRPSFNQQNDLSVDNMLIESSVSFFLEIAITALQQHFLAFTCGLHTVFYRLLY